MKMKISATVFVVLLLFPLAASAQTQPPATAAPVVTDASFHAYGDADKTCQQWTDGCRTCTRRDGAANQCSNIGPTCQPAAISCVRKIEPAK